MEVGEVLEELEEGEGCRKSRREGEERDGGEGVGGTRGEGRG